MASSGRIVSQRALLHDFYAFGIDLQINGNMRLSAIPTVTAKAKRRVWTAERTYDDSGGQKCTL